jgi:hypothetical protein
MGLGAPVLKKNQRMQFQSFEKKLKLTFIYTYYLDNYSCKISRKNMIVYGLHHRNEKCPKKHYDDWILTV